MTGDLAELWAAVPLLSGIHASGDGRWAFWCWSGLAETDEVWCAPLDGSAPPERLTHGEDHFQIRDVSADGGRLLLAQSIHASEHDQLLLLDRESRRLTPLTPLQDSHFIHGGAFSADATAVFFTANFDYDLGEATEGGRIWRQDLATGARRCLARSTAPSATGPLLSPDGRRLLWHRHERAPGGTQIWVLGTDGSDLRPVLDLGPANNARGIWLDDDRIAFVSDSEGQDGLGVLVLSSGRHEWLAREPALCPHEALAGSDGGLLCIHHEAGWTRAALVADGICRSLPNLSGRRSLVPRAALPGGGWLAEACDASAAPELVAVAADGACRVIARAPADARRRFVPPRDFRWTAPDGRAMQGWLYTPEGRPKGLIGHVHGGPTWHSEDGVNPAIQFWVAQGFAVLDPNYRGSTGFGFAHREAVKEDGWGGREQADIRSGLEAALAAVIPGPEATPVAVAGNSYGGFSSWFAIARHADLVTAAIPMCGMYRLDLDYHETAMPHLRRYSEEMMGGTPGDLPGKYADASPGSHIHRIRGHVLIVHGLADSNVGPENAHAAVRELTAARIPHEVLLFADEGHGVFRRSNLATYLRRSAGFLERAFREGMRAG